MRCTAEGDQEKYEAPIGTRRCHGENSWMRVSWPWASTKAAPEPGAEPFVTVGQHVAADSTVCIIEVMKLMTSLRAGYSGVVTHILVDDAKPVEFGQALIVINPNA